jgi:hypothetical protein
VELDEVAALNGMPTGLGTAFVSRSWRAVSFLTGCEITGIGPFNDRKSGEVQRITDISVRPISAGFLVLLRWRPG